MDDAELLGLFVVLVRQARWSRGSARDGTELAPGQLLTSKGALTKHVKRNETWCWRAMNRLRDRNLIDTQPRRGGRAGTIVSICDWGDFRPPKRRRRVAGETQAIHSRDAGETPVQRSRTHNNTNNEPRTSTSPGEEGVESEKEWEVIEREIADCGVGGASQAARYARGAGLTPDAVKAIVEFWLEHRDGWKDPQATLFKRLKLADREKPAGAGWPAFQLAFRTPQQRKRDVADAAAATRDASDVARLEPLYGRKLDTLPRNEAAELAAAAGSRRGQAQRASMLRQLEARNGKRVKGSK